MLWVDKERRLRLHYTAFDEGLHCLIMDVCPNINCRSLPDIELNYFFFWFNSNTEHVLIREALLKGMFLLNSFNVFFDQISRLVTHRSVQYLVNKLQKKKHVPLYANEGKAK